MVPRSLIVVVVVVFVVVIIVIGEKGNEENMQIENNLDYSALWLRTIKN